MTDGELDLARADEACIRYKAQAATLPSLPAIAARLAREGWVPVDPLLIEAREICAKITRKVGFGDEDLLCLAGKRDGSFGMAVAQAALKRGIEIGKAS